MMRRASVLVLLALLTACSNLPGSLPFVDTCSVSTTTARDIYDAVSPEGDRETGTVADESLCDGGPTGRQLLDAERRAVVQWCGPSADPDGIVLTASQIDWDRAVVVLHFDRERHREPSIAEAADELGIDPSLIELFRGNFSATGGCLPP